LKDSNLKKKAKLYEGKAKIVFETDNEDFLIQEFKDDATAFNGKKKGKIKDKGRYNNAISAHLFSYLDNYHVPTHFVKIVNDNSMMIKKLSMIPVEVVMRNVVAGSLVERSGKEEGDLLDAPLLEFYLKDDAQNDPMITEEQILAAEYASPEEIEIIKRYSQKINAVLKSFFGRRNMVLVDFKLEFGRGKLDKIRLGDEISPDTCRFWDSGSGEKLDKDRFRHDLGKVEEAYAEVYTRIFK